MNKKNRLAVWLCLVLTVLMVVSGIPAGAIAVSVEGVTTSEGTAEQPNGAGEIKINTGNPALDDSVPVGNPGAGYTPVGTAISTGEDFAKMDPNGKYYLTANITISATYAGFAGVFDGNGYTVTTTVPLFEAPQGATIKNLTVESTKEGIATVSAGNTGAVACGNSSDCNFFNILNKANVVDYDGTAGFTKRAAGIAGRTAGYTIFERCTNEGKIFGNDTSGGITSLVSADKDSEAVFINCVNKGEVSTEASSAAGIAAAVECPNGVALFYNCRNEGAVTSADHAGGIIAYTNNTSGTVAVRLVGCTNTGVITANNNNAGGMIGNSIVQLTIENCTNELTGKVYAGKAINTNTVNEYNQKRAGGMVGNSTNKTLITGCKNYADVEGTGQNGGIAGCINNTEITVQGCENYGAVTSRYNYAGGIVARADTIGNLALDVSAVISDCRNEGAVTSYAGQVAGIVTYSQTPVTIIRCTNKGNVGPRADAPDGDYIHAGGIAGSFSCPLTVTDCRNDGNVTAKASYTLTDGKVTAQTGGIAGGIIASSGADVYKGVTRVTGCINTGKVTSGESKLADAASASNIHTQLYAGGIVGYQFGSGSQAYLMATYCINTGNVTAAGNAGYVFGYTNSTYGVFTDNVLAGTLTSTVFPTGKNAGGSSVLNALGWNNKSVMGAGYYKRNYVVATFEGPMINNKAITGAGTPVEIAADYRFAADADPFTVMSGTVLVNTPRDTVTNISTAEEFLAMDLLGNYKLTADITLSESRSEYFLGTFDGDNHTITVNGKFAFNAFAAGAVVRNLTIAGSVTHTDSVGALARFGGATFINVHNTASVTASKNHAGGIIGTTNGALARFENCTNSGTIEATTGSASAGGLCGYSDGNYTTYINCSNSGAVTSVLQAGGIVGSSQTKNSANPMYRDCVNTGKITSTGTADLASAGGIQGYNGTAAVYAQGCYNGGEIVSVRYAGGIIGDSAKGVALTACINTGSVTSSALHAGGMVNHHGDSGCKVLSFRNCINTGSVTGKTRVGGMAGELNITSGGNIVYSYCVNTGAISGGTADVGGLVGYQWAGGNVGIDIQNCIVAGTVTSTGARAGALCGYANTNAATIKNNVIAATVTAKTATHLYYGTGTSALTAKANISGNLVRSGSAMYDAQTGSGGTTVALGGNSEKTVAITDFAMDNTVTANVLLAAGINPVTNGVLGYAYAKLLGVETNEANKVAVYNAANELVATVDSLSEVSTYLTEGATVKLLANYYAATPETIVSNGVSYTFDGNGYNFYAANTGNYMLNLSGSGTANVNNLTVYAQGAGVRTGLNRRSSVLNLTFTNVKLYVGSANENGRIRSNTYAIGLYCQTPSLVEIKGSESVIKNATGNLILCKNGVLNVEDGSYNSRDEAVMTQGDNAVINIYGGTFEGIDQADALIRADRGTLNMFGGRFTNNGMCVARTLGGKTKNENGSDNTITTETNGTLNIMGGVLIATPGNTQTWGAVVRCGGSFTYGTVNISGGTLVNQKTGSQQVVFKNNTCASLNITGGKFLASAAQLYFVNTNGCADITMANGYHPTDSHGDVAVGTYSGTCNFEGETYKVWTFSGATDSKYAMTAKPGAQVRMTAGSTGLRFISTITADKIAAAKELAGATGSISYGTVIAPMDYVVCADAFTMEALDAASALKDVTVRYKDIKADAGLIEDENGNVEIRAALTNIQTANLTRAFAAISYVKVVDAEGAVTYYYSEFDGVNNVRSIRQVAEAALADTKTAQSDEYRYATTDADGNTVYSRYSESAREILKGFI